MIKASITLLALLLIAAAQQPVSNQEPSQIQKEQTEKDIEVDSAPIDLSGKNTQAESNHE